MVPPPSESMASMGEVGKEKGWTAWTVWSKHIYDKLEIHFKYNNQMYSKLYIATMLRDKVNMTPIPYQLLFPDRQNCNLPFLLSQVKKLGNFTQERLDVELEEMKYAENADNAEPALWVMEVHKQFGRVLLDVLKVNDYLIIWGGRINPAAKEVVLNATGTAPCFVTIYRHNGINKPTKLQVQYDNPCYNENVDTMFFKGTAGEDVTIVQKIEPKSTTSTTWKEFDFSEAENGPQAENEDRVDPDVPGPSCPHVPQFDPIKLKKEKPDITPRRNVARRGNSRTRRTALGRESPPIDLVDLAEDENSNNWLKGIETGGIAEDNNEDIAIVEVESELENPEPEVMEIGESDPPESIVISETSEEDFPFPAVRQSVTKSSPLASGPESLELIVYDDDDTRSEEGDGTITFAKAFDAEMDKDTTTSPVIPEARVEDSENFNEPESVEGPDISLEQASQRSTMSPESGTSPVTMTRITEEVASLCEPLSAPVDLDDSFNEDEEQEAPGSSRTNAKLLNNILMFPQSQLFSQEVTVVPDTQLFDEIEGLNIESEIEIPAERGRGITEPPSVSAVQDEDADIEELGFENDVDVIPDCDSFDDSSNDERDSDITALVQKAVVKQLFDIKGVSSFHLICQIHEIHEIREKNQVILRVSDGTHVPFVTRKGFPIPPGDDVMLTLQVDILVKNCTQDFRKKLKTVSARSDEDVILSYVLVEKVNQKEYALIMDMDISSDINFGDVIPPQEADKPATTVTESVKLPQVDSISTDENSEIVVNKPGPSSKVIQVAASNVIGDTPQVEPGTAAHAKRRLAFDPPAAPSQGSIVVEHNDAEIRKKFGCQPVGLKVQPIRGVTVGKPVTLDEKFYKSNPALSVEIPAAPVPKAKKSQNGKSKTKPVRLSPSKTGAEESDAGTEILAKLVPKAKKSLNGKSKAKSLGLNPSETESEGSDLAEAESPLPQKKKTSKQNTISSESEESDQEEAKSSPPPKKTSKKKAQFPAWDSEESDLAEAGSPSPVKKTSKKKKIISESESEESEPESPPKKTRSKRKAPATKSKNKKPIEVYDVLDSESEKSDASEPKVISKRRVSPAKNRNAKSKTSKAPEASSGSENSDSPEPDMKRATKRRRVVAKSPPKKLIRSRKLRSRK